MGTAWLGVAQFEHEFAVAKPVVPTVIVPTVIVPTVVVPTCDA